MTAREHIEEIHASSREFKEHLWANHKSRDLVPQVMILCDDGERYSFPIGMVSTMMDKLFYNRGKRVRDWPTAIEAAIHIGLQAFLGQTPREAPAALFGSGGKRPPTGSKLRAVFVVAESYVCPPDYEATVGGGSDDGNNRHLEDDFNNNPDSKVRESLMTFVVEDDLCGGVEWAGATQLFSLDDGGVFVWDEPEFIISDGDHGRYTKDDVEYIVKTNAPLRAAIPYFHQEVQRKEAS